LLISATLQDGIDRRQPHNREYMQNTASLTGRTGPQ
jgi:hypothetical protein